MLILGIDTSTDRTSVALVDRERVVASASLGIARRHGDFLAPAIAFCLSSAGVTATSVTGVAVGLGPGLFTGLRVGIATAQTFASALQLPVVGISGLDVLAFGARHADRPLVAVIDARRREFFWSRYLPVPGGVQRVSEPTVGSLDALEADIAATGPGTLVIGEGAVALLGRPEHTGVGIAGSEHAWPDAADLATLALPRFEREDTERPDELQPIYLRGVDARIGWEQRGRMRGGHAPGGD